MEAGVSSRHAAVASTSSGPPADNEPLQAPWYLYLLECRRGTYAGITNDLAKRYQAHCAGKGARYTRANPPLALLGAQPFADRSEASRAEYRLKQQTPGDKRRWAARWPCELPD